jgi:hypothetical protein
MQRPTILSLAAAVGLALLTAACGSSSTPSTPTEPPVSVTETFTGTLTVNGAITYPFVVQQTGTVTATLDSLAPDASATIGLMIGTWNGAECAPGIPNDAAVVSTTVTGNANGTGNFCARVYDVGKLSAPTDFSVSIVHY